MKPSASGETISHRPYVWAYIVRDKQILRFYFVSGVYKIGATVIRTEKNMYFMYYSDVFDLNNTLF